MTPHVHLLEGWRSLNALGALNTLSEEEVLQLLLHERDNAARFEMLRRLHQRYCTLRQERERAEILSYAK